MQDTNEVVIERQISQINNGGNRMVSFNTGDYILARDYRNNNNKLHKCIIIKSICCNTHYDGTIWKRYNDQFLIDISLTPECHSITAARKINEKPENTETIGTNQNSYPTIINKTSRPIRSRKPPQSYSPNDYD